MPWGCQGSTGSEMILDAVSIPPSPPYGAIILMVRKQFAKLLVALYRVCRFKSCSLRQFLLTEEHDGHNIQHQSDNERPLG